MWVYDPVRNRKTNEAYRRDERRLWLFIGQEITSSLAFDEVRITCDPEQDRVNEAYVYSEGERVAQVGGDRKSGGWTYRDEEPEVIEIRRRLAAGTIIRTYYERNDHPVPEDKEFHSAHWLMELRHPFHTDNRHLFFEHFTRNLEYQPRTLHGEQLFRVPGIWQDTNPQFREIRVHKRGAGVTKPSVPYEGDYSAMVDAFAAEGWTVPIPSGFGAVHQFIQHYGHMTDGTPWWDPTVLHQVTGIEVSWQDTVHQLGAAYRAWEAANATETSAAYAVTREWWKTWIGYAWELVEGNRSSIRVWNTASPRVAREINGRTAVLEWAIGHLQEWAERGVDDFRSSVNAGIIAPILVEPSLTHVQTSGGFGETLVGLIPETDWARLQGRSYRTAAKVVSQVTANAGDDFVIVSGNTISMPGAETIVDGFGDTTYLWELVSGEGATLSATDVLRPTLTPPTLVAETDDVTLVYRLTVTNDGVSDSDEVTVTVRSPRTVVYANAGPDLTVVVNGVVEIVGTATYDNQVGESAYRWERVSGEGSLHDPDSNSPDFTAPATPGTTVYRLTVTNNGVTGTDEVTITITTPQE